MTVVLETVLGVSIGALAVLGALDALYFVLVTHRVIAPDTRWIPPVCRMDERTCASIVDTRYARLFGLSNATYGLAWYLLVLAAAIALLATGTLPYCTPLVLGAALTVAVSVALIWALVQRLKVHCPLCYLAHGLNLALLILLVGACAIA